MRRLVGLLVVGLAAWPLVASCGARTGLEVSPGAAAPDASLPVDATRDGPLFEGGPLDVVTDCPTPTYCVADDPGYIYKCGVRIFQCSSLEQCEKPCGDGGSCSAECVNPCMDTLGQNTSNGCEFYAAEIDTTQEVMGVCYAVFIVNQWETGEPARLEIDQNGQVLPIAQFARIPSGTGVNVSYAPFDPAQGLPKDQVAVLFLSRDPNAQGGPTDPKTLADCPAGVVPALQIDASLHGTGVGDSFHIKSNVPVVAYQMLPYGAGRARVTSATLLLPTNVWGTNYLAANAYLAPTMIGEPLAGPTLAILAQQDGTHVTINPVNDILPGGALQGTPANVPVTYTVDRGHYLQFTQPLELTGSVIQADAPVAVLGANTLMDVPVSVFRADSAQQMLPPIQTLGSEYVGVRYRSRRGSIGEETVPWRIVGAVDGTILTYEPSPPPGAPTAIDSRGLAEFTAPGPFVVRSQDVQHPFYLAQYMTGGETFGDPPYFGDGNPEFVNVVPPAQYLTRYTFFTDPTYPETNLVVVRAKEPMTGRFPDVTLDCAGTLGGWLPIGTSGTYEFTRIDLSTGNFQGQNGCDNGVHIVTANLPAAPLGAGALAIGVTVWGWGNGITWPGDDPNSSPPDEANPLFTRWVSYGYPAGANFTKLNDVLVPAQ